MDDRQSYQQFGYDFYDQSIGKKGLLQKALGNKMASRLKNPVILTALVLLAGAGFAAFLVSSYPASEENQPVPVVKAEDYASVKTTPDDPGGMDVPFQDSEVFETVSMNDSSQPGVTDANLLEPDSEPADRAEALQAQDESGGEAVASADEPEVKPAKRVESLIDGNVYEPKETKQIVARAQESSLQAVPTKEVVPAPVKPVAQKPVVSAPSDTALAEPVEPVSPAVTEQAAKSSPAANISPAGSAPETLAFVRSVLDKKDNKALLAAKADNVENSARSSAAISPASGSPASGDYYVQVGSVSNRAGASTEWAKVQKSFSFLSSSDYRVQEANLGARGIYYRIQAGPFSKAQASALCNQIKAQKPQGCLVVR